MTFNPFENRLCRDIRNHLGHGFVKAVQTQSLHPFHMALAPYQSKTMDGHIHDYICHRENCLKKMNETP